ncbi:MAG: FRG domain-containing protein [Nitrospira sp.]|nr:FRG domain-containing protein [Nitrospira sp.]MDH4304152.1 FRG domain-containing protein [Nitrospira sp.]
MKGQWIGSYGGSHGGLIVLNVDDRGTHFEGVAYLNESNNEWPSVAAVFTTASKDNNFRFRTNTILPISPTNGVIDNWDNVKAFYAPNIAISKFADVAGKWDDESIELSWETELGTVGTCKLPKSRADQPSDIQPLDRDWKGFKEYVSELEGRRYLFRGQSQPWRLRTSFHRAGRADLHRFVVEDIPMLHKHLSARTKHLFRLEIPDENGAFFNLVQHHGYPTPLLDWTYSPYVAAFFAYRKAQGVRKNSSRTEAKVRIFIFDQALWKQSYRQVPQLLIPGPHVSVSEFITIENERMIPQQAASTVTNIDDVETYIASKETELDRKFLWAIDLPVMDRRSVMQELSYMGITAGSLFPGLDGACEALRERNFPYS